MAVEAPARPYSQVDQDKLLALLKEYAGRVREMSDRLDELRFRRSLATSFAAGSFLFSVLALIALIIDLPVLGQSTRSLPAAVTGFLAAVVGFATFYALQATTGATRATHRNLEIYSRQLGRIAQRASEIQDHSEFEQLDAHLELELAMLDAESSIRFAESAMRKPQNP